jgi:hypothetical protein
VHFVLLLSSAELISGMVTGGNLPLEERTSVILTTHSMEVSYCWYCLGGWMAATLISSGVVFFLFQSRLYMYLLTSCTRTIP